MNSIRKRTLTIIMFILLSFSRTVYTEELPGKGINVQPLQSTIAEEMFQTLIVNKAMEALGYIIKMTKLVSYNKAYSLIASGDATYLAASWDPLHGGKYSSAGGRGKFYIKGVYISEAGQGYLIDKKTSRKYNITNISQLKDPNMARLFDYDGDGIADLTGCNPGWGCGSVIEHQIDTFGLRQNITHHQGNYNEIIAATIERYKQGKPIFYYTWAPYWINGVLIPDKDVVWLEVPFSSLPGDRKNVDTRLFNGKNYGFQMNSIRIIVNKKFADDNPAAAKLFELMKLDIHDVSAENVLMVKEAHSPKDIEAHADDWIKDHQKQFDTWISSAKNAAKYQIISKVNNQKSLF